MAASESISLNSNPAATGASAALTFALYPLRFRFAATRALHFAPGESANRLRGQLGKVLFEQSPAAYQRLFTPSTWEGPSGLRDLPRPFVLRVSHLEGACFAPGQEFEIGVNLFDLRDSALAVLRDAVCATIPGALVRIEGERRLTLPLCAKDKAIGTIRVRFVTSTELKGSDSPEFGALFARVRDRISTLRALYGEGPLPIDFKTLGLRAQSVRMTRSELRHIDAERVSRRTAQRHSLGGFVGFAEYEGELEDFVPYLEAARWTGVGRQTVWGKGEIVCEEI